MNRDEMLFCLADASLHMSQEYPKVSLNLMSVHATLKQLFKDVDRFEAKSKLDHEAVMRLKMQLKCEGEIRDE